MQNYGIILKNCNRVRVFSMFILSTVLKARTLDNIIFDGSCHRFSFGMNM